ncbi:tetratricopeptide repeat protein [Methylolobus aquaticus]
MIARQPLLIARFIVLSMLIGIAAALPGCAPRRVAGPAPSAGRPPASLPEAVPLSSKRAAPTSTSETQPSNAVSSPAAEKGPVEPAVIVALLEESAASRSTGDLDNAAASLERALRIQPRNPRLWHELARVRLEQGEPALAEELARKSSALAEDNEGLIAANQQLMEEARQRQTPGAPAPAAAE